MSGLFVPEQRLRYLVEVGSRWVRLAKNGYKAGGTAGGAVRSTVKDFSGKSRMRLLALVSRIHDWVVVDLVTLTMPGNWDDSRDPREAAVMFKTWTRRLRRQYPGVRVIWKREWQRRGAPHWHLLILHPGKPEKAGSWSDEVRRRWARVRAGTRVCPEWVAKSWNDVVSPGDVFHLKAGTRTEVPRKRAALVCYMAKELGKSCQDTWSEVYAKRHGSVGRTWGMVGRGEGCLGSSDDADEDVLEEHDVVELEPWEWDRLALEVDSVVRGRGVRRGISLWTWTVGWTLDGEGRLQAA